MANVSKHFVEEEVACRCGCGKAIIQPLFLYRLETARSLFGLPFKITSWNRCIKRNKEVGGKGTSAHLKGWAADIQTKTRFYQYMAVFYLMLAGFNRIGVGKDFVHCDCDPDKKPNQIWFY